jgi:hypothetical protein
MNSIRTRFWVFLEISVFLWGAMVSAATRTSGASMPLDAHVEKFLNDKRSDWHDWNVPYQDGRVLHDLIVHRGSLKTEGASAFQ